MQLTGVDKFFRGKISQYKKCIFWKKKVTKDWHYLQSTASISPPELAFQFTYSSMITTDQAYLEPTNTFHAPLVSAKQILIFLVLQQEIFIFFNFRDIISTFDRLVKDLEIGCVIFAHERPQERCGQDVIRIRSRDVLY